MDGDKILKFPIINLSGKNFMPDTDLWYATRDKVREAMEHHGWFIVEYNNFPIELHQSILDAAKELLDLPPEIKLKSEHHKSRHGYTAMISDGQPVLEGLSIDQVNDIQHLHQFTHLMWPHAHGNDRFGEKVQAYVKMLEELEQLVIKMLFESYNLEKDAQKHIKGSRYLLRFLKYTGLPNGEPNKALISHTDKSFISILHQDTMKGLMLKSEKEDVWYPFTPSPTRFVVLAGDAIMAWSNDRIKSCYHKVDMQSAEMRYSIVLFSFQKGEISTPEEMVDKDHPLAYKPFPHDGLLDFYETVENHLKADRIMTKAYCGIHKP